MTKEEAISLLTQVNKIIVNNNSWLESTHEPLNTAFAMAIKALEQEPCKDCISRQAVLDKINEVCFSKEKKWIDFRASWGSNGQRDLIIEFIESLSPITSQPKIGHWEYVQYDSNPNIGNWHCSKCRNIAIECAHKNKKDNIPTYSYCPNCGAKMEAEKWTNKWNFR